MATALFYILCSILIIVSAITFQNSMKITKSSLKVANPSMTLQKSTSRIRVRNATTKLNLLSYRYWKGYRV